MSIISLDAHRKSQASAAKKPALPDTPQFHCKQCEGEDFKLYSDGAVHCGSCFAVMNNLTTVLK
jgi:hypothetical protein